MTGWRPNVTRGFVAIIAAISVSLTARPTGLHGKSPAAKIRAGQTPLTLVAEDRERTSSGAKSSTRAVDAQQ